MARELYKYQSFSIIYDYNFLFSEVVPLLRDCGSTGTIPSLVSLLKYRGYFSWDSGPIVDSLVIEGFSQISFTRLLVIQ